MSESPNWSNPLRDSRDLRLPRIAGPCSLVIFGVTGDLAQKKLLPAVYDLANRGLLPPSFGLTGFARRDWTQERFIEFVKAAVQAHCRTPFKESTWRNLAAGIRFVQGTFDDPEAFERLSATVQELDRDRGTQGNHAFYMSVPPRAFPQVAKQLAASGLSRSSEGAWRRVIIEKPFGHDLASAKELDSVVSEVFDPSSVFRIDHYLGKETVQNLLALRFANAMYEPIWNANYVDHVQITMAEDIGIGGRVLTLLIATEDADLEHALEIANSASREHPCRVIAVVPDTNPADQSGEGEPNAAEVAAEVSASRDNPAVDLTDGPNDPNDSNLNAQVRFGADAGAGEIIILRPRGGLINHPDTLVIPLLVPDAPVVAWWPTTPPSNPAKDLMGAMARSRITDALHSNNPEATIERLRRNWTPEDIDLSWTRLTVWRAMLASMLDQPPHLPITAVKVTGKADFLPLEMLCAWLRLKLGVPVETEFVPDAQAVTGVYLTREDGVISLERPHEDQALISLPGQTPQEVSVPMRTIEDCLTEELRRIDPDEIYAEVINEGWDLIRH